MVDPAVLWGIGGTVLGVLVAKVLDLLEHRGQEDRGELRKTMGDLRSSIHDVGDDVDELRKDVAGVREKVAGISAVVDGIVLAPLDPRRRRT